MKICLEKTGPESNVIGDALFEKFFFSLEKTYFVLKYT